MDYLDYLPQSFAGRAAVLATGLGLLYYVFWQLTTGAARRKIIRQRGCQEPPKLHDWDPFWGLQRFNELMAAVREHRLLELSRHRFFNQMKVNTFRLKAAGENIILTIEPENLKSIQATDFKNWSLGDRRITTFLPFLGPGIFTSDGAAWTHSRNMLRPNFVRSQVADFDMMEEHVQDLIANIPKDGSTVDLQSLFFRLTIDSATEFLFGETTGTLRAGTAANAAKFAECFNGSQEHVAHQGRLGFLRFFTSDKAAQEQYRFVHDFVDRYVELGLARRQTFKENPPKRYVFLNELVQQTDDKVQIRSELLNILLAGRDTTASLLSNVWFTLSKRPDVFERLRREVLERFGTDAPSWAQLKEFKYLQAVLNESLRVHPVVPANSRQAVHDTVLPVGGGPDGRSPVFVPKGRTVAWSVYTMHRRPDFYGPDAEEFRPERWLDGPNGEKGLRPGWEYLPFNGGPRICLGQQFALTEAGYATVRLLQAFKGLESRQEGPWREWLTLTCTGFGGCHVAVTPA